MVRKELQRIKNDVVSIAGHKETFDVAHTVNNLIEFQSSMNDDPFATGSMCAIHNVFSGIEHLEHLEVISSLRSKKLRACIMLTNSAVWNWLLVLLPDMVADIANQRPGGQCAWLLHLMSVIRRSLVQGDLGVHFISSDYNVNIFPVRDVVIDFDTYLVPGDSDYAAWTEFYRCVVKEIVEVWLGLPSSGRSRWQGIFVLNILQTLGPEFLYLDYVWNRYRLVNKRMVQSTSLPEQIYVDDYPLLDDTSDLRRNILEISQIVEDYMAGRLDRYLEISSRGAHPGGHTIGRASERLKTDYEKTIIAFKTFVLDCFRFTFRGDQLSNQKLQSLLVENADKYSPFREHAPTRINMRSIDGPFSSANIKTVPGIFSALVCRGVTFGTNFSRLGRTLFTSPDDFQNAVDVCPQVKSVKDYCDPRAYGTNNYKRSPNLVNIYWDKLRENPWPGLDCQENISFDVFYHYLYTPSPARFVELGQLGAYLLTVDYVYAGLVSAPKVEELARMVCKLDRGPARVLERLGLVCLTTSEDGTTLNLGDRRRRENQFVEGFILADKMVRDSIPSEYHEEAGLDVFVTEHMLCKFSRISPVIKSKKQKGVA